MTDKTYTMVFFNGNGEVVYTVPADIYYCEKTDPEKKIPLLRILNPYKYKDYSEYLVKENNKFYYDMKESGNLWGRNDLNKEESKFSYFIFKRRSNSLSFFKEIS